MTTSTCSDRRTDHNLTRTASTYKDMRNRHKFDKGSVFAVAGENISYLAWDSFGAYVS